MQSKVLCYNDLDKECICEFLEMMRGYFTIIDRDEYIKSRFDELTDYLSVKGLDEGVLLTDWKVAYYGQTG